MLHIKYLLNKGKLVLFIGIIMANTLSAQNEAQNEETKFKRDFFDQVEPIKLVDPLAFALGASNAREPYVYYYIDIIKYSGHSCPAVSGGYKMAQIALKELYGNKMPIRGQIKVTMRGAPDDKVNGPISQVISFITGAAGDTGFKGMKGKFNRYNLLTYEKENPSEKGITAEAIFERMDTGDKVNIAYKANVIPTDPEMTKLTPLLVSGKASKEEIIKFGDLWQERVRIVLLETPEEAFNIKSIK